MLKIIGNTVSPYVRKVLTVLALKDIPFEIDPIVPFHGDDEFAKVSPLRRIPVLIDGDFVLSDSSAIVQYLEETHPHPTILPATAKARGVARWLEEYSDTRLGDVFVWKGFGRVVVAPAIFGAPRDLEAFKIHLETEVVEVMGYLESIAPAEGFFVGSFGLADISIGAMFRGMSYARWTPDAARWPRMAALLARIESQPAMRLTGAWSDALVKTAPAGQRDKAREIGLRVTEASYFTDQPRRGPMTRIG